MRAHRLHPAAIVLALCGAFSAFASGASVAYAQSPPPSEDPKSAYALLLRGYDLKQQGRCREAVAPLEASYRAQPTTKALINLAQCEMALGELLRARDHLRTAVDLARRQDARRESIAEESLAAAERQIAHLTLRLAAGAPAGTTVQIDGATVPGLDDVALDPGAHAVTVTAPGAPARTYSVSLAQGDRRSLDVDWRTETDGAPAAEDRTSSGGGSTRRTVGYVLGGVGLVGLGIGAYFGITAHSKNADSNADGHCDATGCDLVGFGLRQDAQSAATASTVSFLLGGAALAAGVVLVLTAPSGRGSGGGTAAQARRAAPTTLTVAPSIVARGGGVAALLVW